MIVAGYTVPPEVEARLVERMRAGEFTLFQLATAAQRLGVPSSATDRLADRLIQRERKAGNVTFERKSFSVRWSWRHPAASPAGREG